MKQEKQERLSLHLFLFFVIHMAERREIEQMLLCLLSGKLFSLFQSVSYFVEVSYHSYWHRVLCIL